MLEPRAYEVNILNVYKMFLTITAGITKVKNP